MSSEISHCPHCGHRLKQPVKPCNCDPFEWRAPDNIPPPCSSFTDSEGGACKNCEHDKECHQ